MSDLPKLSVRLHGGIEPGRCITLAKTAEAHGFHSVWFAENAFNRGVLPAASACAAATSRIGIGIGVFNPYNRHPTLIAMEIGALDELARGRARLGIGSGIAAATERMGLSADRPLAAVRDAITIVRAMLKGEAGELQREGVLRARGQAGVPAAAAGYAVAHGSQRRAGAGVVRGDRRRPDDLEHVSARLYAAGGRCGPHIR